MTNADLPVTFEGRPGATMSEISAFEDAIGLKLPEDYVAFLKLHDGGTGPQELGYPSLYSLSEALEINEFHNVPVEAPGALLIGTNGGIEAFAFDLRTSPAKVVLIPFIGMDWEDAAPVANGFTSFLNKLANGTLYDGLSDLAGE